jgi:hypothetical protein
MVLKSTCLSAALIASAPALAGTFGISCTPTDSGRALMSVSFVFDEDAKTGYLFDSKKPLHDVKISPEKIDATWYGTGDTEDSLGDTGTWPELKNVMNAFDVVIDRMTGRLWMFRHFVGRTHNGYISPEERAALKKAGLTDLSYQGSCETMSRRF